MPIYEYDCKTHGRFEILKGTPDVFRLCPICKKKSIRVFSVPGHRPFKAYWTDAGAVGQPGPTEIKTRDQERELCRKYGMERTS